MKQLWDELCLHAVFHDWNLITIILNDDWAARTFLHYGGVYPGWGQVDWDAELSE